MDHVPARRATARIATRTDPFVVASAVALAWILAWIAPGARAASPAPDFAELDANGDGTLDEVEWAASPIASAMGPEVAAAHYRMYDIDGDGTVSDVEYGEVNRTALEAVRERSI